MKTIHPMFPKKPKRQVVVVHSIYEWLQETRKCPLCNRESCSGSFGFPCEVDA